MNYKHMTPDELLKSVDRSNEQVKALAIALQIYKDGYERLDAAIVAAHDEFDEDLTHGI